MTREIVKRIVSDVSGATVDDGDALELIVRDTRTRDEIVLDVDPADLLESETGQPLSVRELIPRGRSRRIRGRPIKRDERGAE